MAAEIVDIFVAVDIPFMTALRPIDVEGVRVKFAGIVY